MANAELNNWLEGVDRRPILRTDTFRGKILEVASNCNRELYTGADNVDEMLGKAAEAFANGRSSLNK